MSAYDACAWAGYEVEKTVSHPHGVCGLAGASRGGQRGLLRPARTNTTQTSASTARIKTSVNGEGHSEKAGFSSAVCKMEYFTEAVTLELDL